MVPPRARSSQGRSNPTPTRRRLHLILIGLEDDVQRVGRRVVPSLLASKKSEVHHDLVSIWWPYLWGIAGGRPMSGHPRPLPDIPGVIRAGRLSKPRLPVPSLGSLNAMNGSSSTAHDASPSSVRRPRGVAAPPHNDNGVDATTSAICCHPNTRPESHRSVVRDSAIRRLIRCPGPYASLFGVIQSPGMYIRAPGHPFP